METNVKISTTDNKPNSGKTTFKRKNDGESIISRFNTFFETTANTFMLMCKTHFKGSSFYLGNLFIPILISSGVCVFMTMTYGFIWILFLAMTFAGLTTYGTVFYVIRKSTIIKNINMTSNESSTLYLATFLLIGLSLFITFNVILGWTMMLDHVGYIPHEMEIYNNGNPTGIWFVNWGLVMGNASLWYYLVEQIFLCFSLSFLVEKAVNSQKDFFMFVFIYIVAGIFFSGMFSNTLYITESGQIDIVTDSVQLQHQEAIASGDPNAYDPLNGIAVLDPYMWGNPLWWVGQFFPHFGANQMVANITQASAYHEITTIITSPDGEILDTTTEIVKNQWSKIDNFLTQSDSWRVRYYELMPWIWTIGLITIASILERYNKR